MLLAQGAECVISRRLQLSAGRPQFGLSQVSYPRAKSPSLVTLNALWRSCAAGSLPVALMASPPFLPVSPPRLFSFSPSSTRRRIRFVRDTSRFFSMEAAVCLPCGVSQSWSGLESWQWCRRCSRSGRALGALCPVRASKAVVASLSFALHHLLDGIGR
jgi:hypothetical protein